MRQAVEQPINGGASNEKRSNCEADRGGNRARERTLLMREILSEFLIAVRQRLPQLTRFHFIKVTVRQQHYKPLIA